MLVKFERQFRLHFQKNIKGDEEAMAIKKRAVAGKATPTVPNHDGLKKKSVLSEELTSNKYYQHEAPTQKDAFAEALVTAEKNKKRVMEIQVGEKKAQPKIKEGRFIAITTEAKLEQNIESKYGTNDRVTITFEVLLDQDGENSVTLIEKFWVSRSDSSRYYQLLSQLLKFDARQGFHIKDLIGVACEVIVVHNEISSGTYANISDLEVISMEGNNK